PWRGGSSWSACRGRGRCAAGDEPNGPWKAPWQGRDGGHEGRFVSGGASGGHLPPYLGCIWGASALHLGGIFRSFRCLPWLQTARFREFSQPFCQFRPVSAPISPDPQVCERLLRVDGRIEP